jgi:hypothetical protein
VHRHSASKTRVNALMALHRIRETQPSEARMGGLTPREIHILLAGI